MGRSRSRSPISEHEHDDDRTNEYRIHVAELSRDIQEDELRKIFQRHGTVADVFIANASGFAFIVYKQKDEAQRAIDALDGRSLGNNRLKVTWARPRTRTRSHRYDPNLKCFKCGQRGHFSRGCQGLTAAETRSTHRRDQSSSSSSSRSRRYSRSRSPNPSNALPPPAYFRHGMPMYPEFSRRKDESNGHEHRVRGVHSSPPRTSSRHHRR